MTSDPGADPSGPGAGARGGSTQTGEEELRAAYEAELSRITSAEMMLQAAVSLLNIGGRRLGPIGPGADVSPGAGAAGASERPAGTERDLEQVRDAIDGVSALLGILERRMPRELRPLRDALSQLQMAYARAAQAAEAQARPAPAQAPGEVPGGEASDGEPGAPASATPGVGAGATKDQDTPEGDRRSDRPGPAESSGRLWVPGR